MVEGLVRRGWNWVVRAPGWGERDLGRGSRVDLCVFFPQFSTNSHLLGENKVNRNPLIE